MKRLPAIILFIIIAQNIFAQNTAQLKQLADQGNSYEQSGDNVKAFNSYLAAFNLDRTSYDAAIHMAAIAGKMNDYRTQLIWAQKAMEINSKPADAYINLGKAYAGQKNYTEAENNFNKAIAIDNKNPDPLYQLGRMEHNKGDYAGALKYYKQVAVLDDDFDTMPYFMADAYDRVKDVDNAYQTINHYRTINDNAEVTALWHRITKEIAAKPFAYPVLPKSGKALTDFVAAGWTIKGKGMGDLNGDKLPDAAVVLEYNQLVREIRFGNDTIYNHPRVLLVLLKDGDHYNLLNQHNTFMLRENEGSAMGEDPYADPEIDKGILNVDFQFLRGMTSYKFRYQQGDLYLIRASQSGVDANVIESWYFNFLTRKIVHSWGESPDGTTKGKTETLAIPVISLKKLNDLKEPYAWQIRKDVFI